MSELKTAEESDSLVYDVPGPLQSRVDRQDIQNWFKLSVGKIKFLYGYYILLSILGLALANICVFTKLDLGGSIDTPLRALLAGMGSAVVGSTLFYLRKLYKSSIQNVISFPDEKENVRSLGVFFYFVLRPWFSAVFSALILLIIKSSVHSITADGTQYTLGLVYLMSVVSFFAGFASGDVITHIESRAREIAVQRLYGE
jgi:hypothetical protein